MPIERSEEAINVQRNRAAAQSDKGGTRYRGQTYEEGVDDAIRWMLGESDDEPLGPEYDEDSADEDNEG